MIRWLGFAAGMALLLITASSVIKTLLIPRSARSAMPTRSSSERRKKIAG